MVEFRYVLGVLTFLVFASLACAQDNRQRKTEQEVTDKVLIQGLSERLSHQDISVSKAAVKALVFLHHSKNEKTSDLARLALHKFELNAQSWLKKTVESGNARTNLRSYDDLKCYWGKREKVEFSSKEILNFSSKEIATLVFEKEIPPPQDMIYLEAFLNLRELVFLEGLKFTSDQLVSLSGVESIKSLTFQGVDLSQVEHLGNIKLTGLQVLWFTEVAFSDRAIRSFAHGSLPSIEQVTIAGTNAKLSTLERFRRLEGNPIFQISRSSVSQNELDLFQKKYPYAVFEARPSKYNSTRVRFRFREKDRISTVEQSGGESNLGTGTN